MTKTQDKVKLREIIKIECSHPHPPHGCEYCNHLTSLVFEWHNQALKQNTLETLELVKLDKKLFEVEEGKQLTAGEDMYRSVIEGHKDYKESKLKEK